MTEQEWADEVVNLLRGGAWRLSHVGVSIDSGTCSARVVNADGEERSALLMCDEFTTPAMRAAEMLRQLKLE